MTTRTRKAENTNERFEGGADSQRNELSLIDDSFAKMAGWPVEVWLHCQEGMLNAAQPVASGWIERRREAVTATLDTLQRLRGCSDVNMMASIQRQWLDGAMKRIDSDFRALADQAMALSREAVAASRFAAETSSEAVSRAIHIVPRHEEQTEEAA